MIPIFIITRDRVSVLKQCLPGYLALGDVEIVIHDNDSTYPPMIEYLKQLESEGIKVFRYPGRVQTFDSISDLVVETINTWYSNNDSLYYIVTDPDILLEHPSPKLIERYIEILYKVPEATCVGPMLRIDDLPKCFKFREQMIHSHMEQFWGSQHKVLEYKDTKIQWAPIDTTFAIYRKVFKFHRLNMGVRVHEPYMAKHLDWYMDTDNLTDEQEYYKNHATDVSTMSRHIRMGGMY